MHSNWVTFLICFFGVSYLHAQKPIEAVSRFKHVEYSPPSDSTRLVFVKGGSYRRGGTVDQHTINQDEFPVRKIKISDFYIGKYETTIAEYDSFCLATGRKPVSDHNIGRDDYPVMDADWYEAILYCNWRSEREGFKPCYTVDSTQQDMANSSLLDQRKWIVQCDWTANGYRLPTESEWEYAARGGRKSKHYTYSGGKKPDEVAWYKKNSDSTIHKVGTIKRANELGIYDMSGNVWEWCWDWYDVRSYSLPERKNPTGATRGEFRCLRGGSWVVEELGYLRVANRGYFDPVQSYNFYGFRVVRPVFDRIVLKILKK